MAVNICRLLVMLHMCTFNLLFCALLLQSILIWSVQHFMLLAGLLVYILLLYIWCVRLVLAGHLMVLLVLAKEP